MSWRNVRRYVPFFADLTGNAQKWAATSVEALEDATPELIPYEELDFNMGERWIPASIYASFAKDLFGGKHNSDVF